MLPGTSTHDHDGEAEGHRGIWSAVEEFLAQGTFRLQERFYHNHGLTAVENNDELAGAGVGQATSMRPRRHHPGGSPPA